MLIFGGIPERGSTILVLRINTNVNLCHKQLHYLQMPIFGGIRERGSTILVLCINIRVNQRQKQLHYF
jgi:hypothetical protein